MRVESSLVNGIKSSFDKLDQAVQDINKELAANSDTKNIEKNASSNKTPNLVNDTVNIITNKQQENADVAALKVNSQMKGSILNIIA